MNLVSYTVDGTEFSSKRKIKIFMREEKALRKKEEGIVVGEREGGGMGSRSRLKSILSGGVGYSIICDKFG